MKYTFVNRLGFTSELALNVVKVDGGFTYTVKYTNGAIDQRAIIWPTKKEAEQNMLGFVENCKRNIRLGAVRWLPDRYDVIETEHSIEQRPKFVRIQERTAPLPEREPAYVANF